MKFSYLYYLWSKEWEETRKKVKRRDRYRCQVCLVFDYGNDVHHMSYQNINTPKEIDDCITLCREHHYGIHRTNYYLKTLK